MIKSKKTETAFLNVSQWEKCAVNPATRLSISHIVKVPSLRYTYTYVLCTYAGTYIRTYVRVGIYRGYVI